VEKGPVAAEGPTKLLYNNLPKTFHKSRHTSTSKTWHLQTPHARTSYRGSRLDFHKVFRPGIHRNLCKKNSARSHKNPSMRELGMKLPQAQSLRTRNLRGPNVHIHTHTWTFDKNNFPRYIAAKYRQKRKSRLSHAYGVSPTVTAVSKSHA